MKPACIRYWCADLERKFDGYRFGVVAENLARPRQDGCTCLHGTA
jgi:hypothetical protein